MPGTNVLGFYVPPPVISCRLKVSLDEDRNLDKDSCISHSKNQNSMLYCRENESFTGTDQP